MDNDDPENKRIQFEEVMRRYFPPEKFPHLWCSKECKNDKDKHN